MKGAGHANEEDEEDYEDDQEEEDNPRSGFNILKKGDKHLSDKDEEEDDEDEEDYEFWVQNHHHSLSCINL